MNLTKLSLSVITKPEHPDTVTWKPSLSDLGGLVEQSLSEMGELGEPSLSDMELSLSEMRDYWKHP